MGPNGEIECHSCHEEFDARSRCPRTLVCFHILCTPCINQLIKTNAKQCPICCRPFEADDFEEIIVSHTLIAYLSYFFPLTHEDQPTIEQGGVCIPSEKTFEQFRSAIGKAGSSLKSTYHRKQEKAAELARENIAKNIDCLKDLNTTIENVSLPSIHSIISQNNNAIEELDKLKKELQKQQRKLKAKQKLVTLKGSLQPIAVETPIKCNDEDSDSEDLDEAFAKIVKVTKESDTQERRNVVSKKDCTEAKETYNGARAKTFSGVPRYQNQMEEINPKMKPKATMSSATPVEKENIPAQVRPKAQQEIMALLKHHAMEKKIFAIQHSKGVMKSAKIAFSKGKLLLHRLRKKHPPPGVHVVYHSEVMKLVEPSSRLTFLELCEDYCMNFGKVYIRLFGDTNAAKQFTYLCTGETGPSFRGSNAVGLYNEGHKQLEYVRMGDYEKNDGTGGKSLVPGLKTESTKDYIRPWLAGTLEGGWVWRDEIAAQFDILMKDNPGRLCEAAFGIVEEGFKELKEGVTTSSDYIESLIIRDCGVVLSC